MGTAKVRTGYFCLFGVLTKAGLGADCHAPVSPKSPSHPEGGLFVSAPAFAAGVTVTVLCSSYLMRILPGTSCHVKVTGEAVCVSGVFDAAVTRLQKAERAGAWLWR